MRFRSMCAGGLGVLAVASLVAQDARRPMEPPPWQAFIVAAQPDDRAAKAALEEIGARWQNGYTAMLLDLARLLPSARSAPPRGETSPAAADDPDAAANLTLRREPFPAASEPRPGAKARQRLTTFLEKQTGQRFGDDLRAWRRWVWSRRDPPHADYAVFKAEVFARLDPAFRTFFPSGVNTAIRLDEIAWGGVVVNGIPPLRLPKTIPAAGATWLRDNHVVFGIEANGEARAYPKRILAWHELAIDRFAGLDLTVVYCTLCGTVIPYESRVGKRTFTFGTSGLLYRSNKLMFDEETRSLWSALDGTPVVGPLVGTGLRLRVLPVVTTTWGEWKRDHPATSVLSLDTGFKRDYAEGAAYRDYFATDRIMFDVPSQDTRLRNKAEVLVIRSELIGPAAAPVAIDVDLLRRQPVFAFDAGGRGFVVISSKQGAHRVYERGGFAFVTREPSGHVRDREGRRWAPGADALVRESGERVPRVAAHQAFWFGWHAQYPDTILYR